MAGITLAGLRLLMALLFVVAGYSKASRPYAARRRWLDTLSVVPGFTRAPLAVLLPTVETAVGVVLLTGAFGWVGPAVALMLLVMFTSAVAVMLVQRVEADCGCFSASGQISWLVVVRNVFLTGGCVLFISFPTPVSVESLPSYWQAAVVTAGVAGLLGLARYKQHRVQVKLGSRR
ncbi:MauE/DoxX family redox-associated membrane protein [Streptomyces roseus]|uniref:MauE/DoxX family redox-associated membrane protein n=1 Tax=Streptomyces roseus TaxID=66430 RepID=UPI00381837F4